MHRFIARYLCAMLTITLLVFGSMSAFSAESMPFLKAGDKGTSVFSLQLSLFQLGFLTTMPSGSFDSITANAVRAFQSAIGLQVDGAVGSQTWQQLNKAEQKVDKTTHTVQPGDTLWSLARKYGVTVYMITQANSIKDSDELKIDQKIVIPVAGKANAKTAAQNAAKPASNPAVKTDAQKAREAQARLAPALMPWSDAQKVFQEKAIARVVDVATGRSFRVRRLYGHSHADSEPLTAEDTATLKSLYGGKFSWDRRPVIVEVNGRRIAASINGYPHGGDTISTNNFKGHICIHFLGSKTHGSNRVDPDHQAAIRKAAASTAGAVISH